MLKSSAPTLPSLTSAPSKPRGSPRPSAQAVPLSRQTSNARSTWLKGLPVMPKPPLFRSSVIVLPLLLLAVGCATQPEPLPPEPVLIQAPRLPLPPEARQPAPPPICLPSCLQGLMRERESWLRLLKPEGSQGLPAKP